MATQASAGAARACSVSRADPHSRVHASPAVLSLPLLLMLLLLSALQALPGAQAARNQYCNKGATWCVQSLYQPTRSGPVVSFAVSSNATGWAAFGIGTGMADATIILGWMSRGNPVVSERLSRNRTLPSVITRSIISSQNTTSPLWKVFPEIPLHKTRFVVGRFLISTNGVSKNVTSGIGSYMWAYSNTPPTNPTSSASAITQHAAGNMGVFRFDFTKEAVSTASPVVRAAVATSAPDMLSNQTAGSGRRISTAGLDGKLLVLNSLFVGLLSVALGMGL